ncbi:MAG TPA: hypothetical protein VGK35_03255 [Actinotalea sp.]
MRRQAFTRDLSLPGWDGASRWGYDAVLECYWVELRSPGRSQASLPDLAIGPEHLLTTLSGLARAMAFAAEVDDSDAYLALTA